MEKLEGPFGEPSHAFLLVQILTSEVILINVMIIASDWKLNESNAEANNNHRAVSRGRIIIHGTVDESVQDARCWRCLQHSLGHPHNSHRSKWKHK
mmetsp:Transcript_3443/g.8047  ORF Transcript_3443/g.8047 Transcript_3443/m.8047 type:complete len:96 (+) Transcript_3443:127-414(+)